MSNLEHFNNLRRKFFKKTATPRETEEFIDLFKSGKFADEDMAANERDWNDKTASFSEEDRVLADKVYERIRDQHIHAPRHRTLNWPWMAAAAALLIFSLFGIWRYKDVQLVDNQVVAESSVRTFAGPFYVQLPDSSTVELMAGSTLSYDAETFGRTSRELKLKGTGFFDVTHNPKLPFLVKSGRVITTVLGTAFNVSESDNIVEVVVVRGRVNVGDSTNVFNTINPHEKITVATKNMTYVTRTLQNTDHELGWKANNLILEHATMSEAVKQLETRHNVSITMPEALKACNVSVFFVNGESLTEILDVLCRMKQASYTIDKNNIAILGGSGCGDEHE